MLSPKFKKVYGWLTPQTLLCFLQNSRKSMASSSILLLSAFSFSLLLLTVPSHRILDPTSATLAINQATGTVCGIMALSEHHSIQCTTLQDLAGFNTSFLVDPTLSFDSISGGHNFICSLRAGDPSFFCWDGINPRVKRLNSGPMVLTQISVGARHVAAIAGNLTNIQTIRWWRHGCHSRSRPCRHFPKSVDGVFHSLTSGDVFTCAIGETHEVHCWGPHAKSIMLRFAGVYMRSVTAGGSRMCGLSMTGHLICSGDQLKVPSGEAFEFTSVAAGSSHTCAIRRYIGTVVCWGRYGSYSPVGRTSFEFLVAGGDLTCGLTTSSFDVACWGLNETELSAITPSLPTVLPGVCIPDEIFCSCGVYPDSRTLCGASGVICQRSHTSGTEPCPFTFMVHQPPSASLLTTLERPGKWWFFFAIFGIVLAIVGVGCLLYLLGLRLGWCGGKKINAVLEEVGDLGMQHLEVFSFNDLKAATDNFCTPDQLVVGYGAVYQGCLSDGRRVAVKHCHTQPGSASLLNNELEKLSVVRHPNIVSLIGYSREKHELCTVLEYAGKKQIHGCLHPEPEPPESNFFFSWKIRVSVLLDAARGIECLHCFANPHIIHRGIKSSNILLNENWVAKISDFGLALFGPNPGKGYVKVDELAGTVEYMDPLASQNKCVAPNSDVYSFGVIMLEVLTGREALDNDSFLADLVVTPGYVEDVLDMRLAPPVGCEMKAVKKVMQLAQKCVRRAGFLRPAMTDVVSELEGAFALFD